MSSIFSSYLTHDYTAFFYRICTASYTLFRMNAGTTKLITSSLLMNYHKPSEATIMNLSSEIVINFTFC